MGLMIPKGETQMQKVQMSQMTAKNGWKLWKDTGDEVILPETGRDIS